MTTQLFVAMLRNALQRRTLGERAFEPIWPMFAGRSIGKYVFGAEDEDKTTNEARMNAPLLSEGHINIIDLT
jgi:hypothetical protein